MDERLTHLDDQGRAQMVDIGSKAATQRMARARGQVVCRTETVEAVLRGDAPKGAVLSTAEIAGIMAAKRTADLIPLCHPLALSRVAVTVTPDRALPGFAVTAEVRTTGPTGVEMEALTAVSTACLTVFDMLKAIDRTMVIGAIAVEEKTGGASGDWARG